MLMIFGRVVKLDQAKEIETFLDAKKTIHHILCEVVNGNAPIKGITQDQRMRSAWAKRKV